jgi:hypothetical protein
MYSTVNNYKIGPKFRFYLGLLLTLIRPPTQIRLPNERQVVPLENIQ